jgi:hypothetical protein
MTQTCAHLLVHSTQLSLRPSPALISERAMSSPKNDKGGIRKLMKRYDRRTSSSTQPPPLSPGSRTSPAEGAGAFRSAPVSIPLVLLHRLVLRIAADAVDTAYSTICRARCHGSIVCWSICCTDVATAAIAHGTCAIYRDRRDLGAHISFYYLTWELIVLSLRALRVSGPLIG